MDAMAAPDDDAEVEMNVDDQIKAQLLTYHQDTETRN